MNPKRAIIWGGTIIVVILAVTWGWRWWQQRSPATQSETGGQTNTLFPSGQTRPSNIVIIPGATSTVATSTDDEQLADRSGKFFRVTTKPVGGVISLGQGTSSAIIYVEKATGHLYRLAANTAGPERISNTTIPKIYRLLGGQNATSTQIIFQYLKDNSVQTFSGRLSLASSTSGQDFLDRTAELAPLSGGPLSQNIKELAISPQHDQLFTLEISGNDNVGYVSKIDGSKKEVLFHSPYPDWRAGWATSSVIALSTKAGPGIPGALFLFNLKTKNWEKIASDVPDLTVRLSPRLDRAVYSGYGQNGLTFGFYDLKQHFFGRLDIRTWADKCVWNQQGTVVYCAVPADLPAGYRYPDDWYRGEVALSDNIWRLDPTTNRAEIVFSPAAANLGLSIDADNLVLTPDESTLYLINRHDNNLWALNVGEGF